MERCFNCGGTMFVLYKHEGQYNPNDIVVHWKCNDCNSEKITYQ